MKLSQFIHRHDLPFTAEVMDRIYEHHFLPLSQIERSVPINHIVCFRHKLHEYEKGRVPKGQEAYVEGSRKPSDGRDFWSTHTFEKNDRDPEGKGACDLSANDMVGATELVTIHIQPSRIALYPWGIHYDYAWWDGNVKYYNSGWEKIGKTAFFEKLKQ